MYPCENAGELEKGVHNVLAEYRIQNDIDNYTEWFDANLDVVIRTVLDVYEQIKSSNAPPSTNVPVHDDKVLGTEASPIIIVDNDDVNDEVNDDVINYDKVNDDDVPEYVDRPVEQVDIGVNVSEPLAILPNLPDSRPINIIINNNYVTVSGTGHTVSNAPTTAQKIPVQYTAPDRPKSAIDRAKEWILANPPAHGAKAGKYYSSYTRGPKPCIKNDVFTRLVEASGYSKYSIHNAKFWKPNDVVV
jgi:hypothetical protein